MSPAPGSVLFIVLIYPALTEALDRETLLYLSAETLTISTYYFKITHSHCTCLWGSMWFFHTVRVTSSVSGLYVPLGGRRLPASRRACWYLGEDYKASQLCFLPLP